MSWRRIVQTVAGAGGCGCLRPDLGHDSGCLWALDRRHARAARQRHLEDIVAEAYKPRRGCCWLCGDPLDGAAIRFRDDRCTPCFKATRQHLRDTLLNTDGKPGDAA